jgi:hypothetical protein
MSMKHHPLALSLSKGCPFSGTVEEVEVQGFDKLSLNGLGGIR